MKKSVNRHFMPYAFVLFLFSFSCNKEIGFGENDSLPPDISGRWIFMSNTVFTESITSYSLDGMRYRYKIVADYVTYNNNGSVTIASNTMNGTDLKFDVDTMVDFTFYIGDDDDEASVEAPFIKYMDTAYSASRSFKFIDRDSVYFPSGILMAVPDVNGNNRMSMNLPQGGNIRLFDNSMKIITNTEDKYHYTEEGIIYEVIKKERVETDLAKLP